MAVSQKCMGELAKALGKKELSKAEAEAYETMLESERARGVENGLGNDPLAASQRIAAYISREKALEARMVVLRKLAWQELRGTEGNFLSKPLALLGKLVGSNTLAFGSRYSAAATYHGLRGETLGALLADLRRLGPEYVKLFSNKEFEPALYDALEWHGKQGAPATLDKRAVEIAAAIDMQREFLRLRENRAGSWRGRLEGYISRQSHNSRAVNGAGFDKWYADIIDKLDHEKTFGGEMDLLTELRRESAANAVRINETTGLLKTAAAELRASERRVKQAENRAATGERKAVALGGQVELAQRQMRDLVAKAFDIGEQSRAAAASPEAKARGDLIKQHEPALKQLEEDIGELGKLAGPAEQKLETARAAELASLTKLEEAQRSYGAALDRHLDLSEKARGAPGEAAPAAPADARYHEAIQTVMDFGDTGTPITAKSLEEAGFSAKEADQMLKRMTRDGVLADDPHEGLVVSADRAEAALGTKAAPEVEASFDKQLGESRVALTRARSRTQELHEQWSANRARREAAGSRAEGFGERLEKARANADALAAAIDKASAADAAVAAHYEKAFGKNASRLTSARNVLNELHDRLSGAEFDAAARAEAVARAAETASGAADQLAKVEGQLDLLNKLKEKHGQYEDRLKRPVIDKKQFMYEVWKDISEDRWASVGDEPDFSGNMAGPRGLGGENLAARRSAQRVLHFKSGADAHAYAKDYGSGNLAAMIVQEFDHTARAVALLETFGPNPRQMIQKWRETMAKELSNAGKFDEAREVMGKRYDNQVAALMGDTRRVASHQLAAFGTGVRALESMTKLGGATLASLPDLPAVAAQLQYNGYSFLGAWGAALGNLFRGRSAGDTRVIADLLGVGFDSILGHVASTFHGNDLAPGKMAKALHLFFRLGFLNWWTDSHKTGAGLMTSRYFAMMRDRGYGDLDAGGQRMLKGAGISPVEWDLIRSSSARTSESGREFLVAEGVRAIELRHFYDLAAASRDLGGIAPGERALLEARDRLATKFSSMIVDAADYAVPTPGIREEAIITQGTMRGTVPGEALRFGMQFKSYGVSMLTKVIGRSMYGYENGSRLSAIGRTGWLIAQLTAMGYLSQASKDILRGKEPRPVNDPKTWMAAMAAGGGMGIMGDFLFGEYNRYGNGIMSTLAGPSVSSGVSIASALARWRDVGLEWGDTDTAIAQTWRTAVANTPFINLFWLRPVLDYSVLYPMAETLNPGFLDRYERRVEREQGQRFWAPPTAVGTEFFNPTKALP